MNLKLFSLSPLAKSVLHDFLAILRRDDRLVGARKVLALRVINQRSVHAVKGKYLQAQKMAFCENSTRLEKGALHLIES